MNLEKSIKFVRKNGNIIEKARLDAILWIKKPSNEVIANLGRFQNADGGFSYWVKKVSIITDTCYV
ncbi:MAG: hypothetical protein ACFFKA_02220, partial [Candidatus Thorarchaeota archaeon]